jgi:flagellar FliL protein
MNNVKGMILKMSKFVKLLIVSVCSFLILSTFVIVFIVNHFDEVEGKPEQQSIGEMNKYAYSTPEITTDLLDGRFVRIQFTLITDGSKAQKEVKAREFQVTNLIIKELSLLSAEDFSGGLNELESSLTEGINHVMEDGTITDVYTVSKILQ